MEIKKSPKADLEKGKTLSILMGFVVGLAVLFVGFEWSTRDVMVVQASEGVADIIAEEEVEIVPAGGYNPSILEIMYLFAVAVLLMRSPAAFSMISVNRIKHLTH